jgi:D-3-phosphoglycerate dehydrogenase / 2-oxoglutarate reductase
VTKKKVLIAAPVHDILTEGLQQEGYELLFATDITQDRAYGLIASCSGVITSTRLLLDKPLIDAAPALTFIGRMGSGMEVIDQPYAAARGIACYASPEGNCNAVAEHALGMLLALNKRIVVSNREVLEGQWLREQNRGTELEGKTIALIGYGHTGRALARKLQGFDMQVLAYDKYYKPVAEMGITVCDDLRPVFDRADIVSFHVPIAADTHHYFDEHFLEQMAKPFVLVNTSRGEVLDTGALIRGLEDGRISGACLDVFEEEPPVKMSPGIRALLGQLSGKDNVVLTPHIAGYSHEALYKMSKILLERIIRH